MIETGAFRTGHGTVFYTTDTGIDEMTAGMRALFPEGESVDPSSRDREPEYHEELQRPHNTAHWAIARGASVLGDRSAVDWWTGTETDSLAEHIADRFRETTAFHRVGKRAEVPAYLEQAYPRLGRCGMAALALGPVWERVKESGQGLYGTTEQVLENVSNGREFEAYFTRFCEDNGLAWYRDSADALGQRRPEVYAELPTLTGIPDYLVDRGDAASLTEWTSLQERDWAPRDGFALVEVKYNESPLSESQQEMVDQLRDHGVDTYLFRGTPDTSPSISLLDG